MANKRIYTSPMNTERTNHTATLLPNGQVLVVGGVYVPYELNSAELYDPSTDKWTPIKPFTCQWTPTTPFTDYGPSSHTATLLTSGEVLVAGGVITGIAQKNTVLFDNTTGKWTLVGNLSVPRYGHTATLLPNGQVLVVGGWTYIAEPAHETAELYDPKTRTWAVVGNLNVARGGHTATLLPNGQVLVAGGWDEPNNLNTSELYNPATGKWVNAGILQTIMYPKN